MNNLKRARRFEEAHGIVRDQPEDAGPPAGFKEDHDLTLACPHRDLSCCPTCRAAHEEIVEVAGAHFWIENPSDREKFRAPAQRKRNPK